MASSYPYRPLQLPSQTRVLELEVGKFEEPLRGRLEHISLSSSLDDSYDALSYCRNCSTKTPPPQDKFEIAPAAIAAVQNGPKYDENAPIEGTPHGTIVNLLGRMLTIHMARYESLFYKYGWPLPVDVLLLDGVEVAVGGELAAALRRLRDANEERRIWIDAVCINQNDIAEKNEHVKMMGQIYAQASMVHVWLGEQYGDEEGALKAFVIVLKVFEEMAERTNGAMNEDIGEARQRFFRDERVNNLDFAAVDELLRRTWVSASHVIEGKHR